MFSREIKSTEILVAVNESGEPAKSLNDAVYYVVNGLKLENNRFYNVLGKADGVTTTAVYKKK